MESLVVKVPWADQTWHLLGERAVLWQETKTLILSDVHLGKAEDFQAAGIPIPSQVHEADLGCLEALILEHHPKRVLILGDFVHSNRFEHPNLLRLFRELKNRSGAEWILVLGNHDFREAPKLQLWGFDHILRDWTEAGILFTHIPRGEPNLRQIHGHVHPVLRLKTKRDRVRLPCFLINANTFMLPAFGAFTGGFEVSPEKSDQIYLIAENSVVRWC